MVIWVILCSISESDQALGCSRIQDGKELRFCGQDSVTLDGNADKTALDRVARVRQTPKYGAVLPLRPKSATTLEYRPEVGCWPNISRPRLFVQSRSDRSGRIALTTLPAGRPNRQPLSEVVASTRSVCCGGQLVEKCPDVGKEGIR